MYVQTFSFPLLASVLKRELVPFCCYFGAEESLIITLVLGYCMTISTVAEQLAATVFVNRKSFYHRLNCNPNAWILSLPENVTPLSVHFYFKAYQPHTFSSH